MRKLFSLIAAVLFAGSMMATEVTVSKTVEELATANSWANGTVVTPFALDEVITVSTNATDANTGKYYTSGQQVRLYQSGAAELIISAAEGYTISSITLTYVSQNTGIFVEAESGVAVDFENVQSATFTVGNSGEATNGQARVTSISVTYDGGEVPPTPEHTYTVAGMESVFGTNWTPSDANNDMTKQEDGTYKWEKANLELAAGNVEFKVCEDHAWTVAYPAQNYVLAIEEAGIYTITITFDPANDNAVNAVATKTGSAEIDPVVSIAGSMNSWSASANVMTLAEDKATATLALNLEAQTYDFKVVLNGGEWRSNAQEFTRENASATDMTGNEDNMHLVADVAGEYVFTWTFADNSLAITYPEAPVAADTIVIDIEDEVEYIDMVAAQGWWQFMYEDAEYSISISNVSTTQAAGVYTVADLDADYTYIEIKATETEVHFVDGSLTLTEAADGSRTIEGAMTGDDGKIYNIKIVYHIPTAKTTVNVEIPKWALVDASEYYGFAGYILAGETADKNIYVQITIPGSSPLGTFTYDDCYAGGTGIEVAGDYKGIYSMNFTVTAGGTAGAERAFVTADILCYNNTLYHVTTLVGEGVDAIEAAEKAVKMIQNGQVVIIKNGVHYNINGAVIR